MGKYAIEQLSNRHYASRITHYTLYFTLHVLLWLLLGSQSVFAAEFSGHIAIDGRLFTREPLADVQHGKENLSILFEPEFYHEWADSLLSRSCLPC